jgi:hypothetical protein
MADNSWFLQIDTPANYVKLAFPSERRAVATYNSRYRNSLAERRGELWVRLERPDGKTSDLTDNPQIPWAF